MSNLIKYFIHIKLADRLPRLPRQWANDYDPHDVSNDDADLMRVTAIRSPHGVKILKRRYRLESSQDLKRAVPVRFRPNRGNRLLPLLRRIFGLSAHDPMRRIYHQHRRKSR